MPASCPYDNKQVKYIRFLYVLLSLFWIVLIILYRLFPTRNLIEIFILSLPLIIFLISGSCLKGITPNVEKFLFKSSLLTIGLLMVVPLLNWIKDGKGDKAFFIKLTGTAVIFSMIPLIDVWVGENKIGIVKHLKSGFQTMSICLMIYALFIKILHY